MAGVPPSQIIVVRLGSIGDVLLATPLVRVLRKGYPGARLRFLVKAPYAELVEGNPHIDEVLRWPHLDRGAGGGPDADGGHGAHDPAAPPNHRFSGRGEAVGGATSPVYRAAPLWSAALRDLVRGLRARRPLWVVDLQASPRSLAIALALRPDRLFRYRKDYLRRALLVRAGLDRYPQPFPSVAERYFGAVRELGLRPDGEGMELVVGEEAVQRARAAMEPAGGGGEPASAGPWLGLGPGASWATKRWPPEAFAAAARVLAAPRGWRVALLGSASDVNAARTVATLLRDAGLPALDLSGKLSLLESASALGRCRLFLTNDSGLMHVAAALRVPAVALFGSTVPQLGFAPYAAPAHVLGVEGLPCRPCTHVGRQACPLGHFRCMRELHPARVVRAAEELLAGAEGAAQAGPA